MSDARLYDPAFVRRLFDEMSATYGVVHMISSLGFGAALMARDLSVHRDSYLFGCATGVSGLKPGAA